MYHKLISPTLIHIITVQNSTIISEKDKTFLKEEELNEISHDILNRSREDSIYNVIFVCDCDGDAMKTLFKKECVKPIRNRLEKLETKTLKKDRDGKYLSYWVANHFDLCYGAKKFQKYIPKNLFDSYRVPQMPLGINRY
jgi:hypothetical protein